MGELDEHGRPEPPLGADEEATLVGFLEWQRATFAWKCAGVDVAGLTATVWASLMTLGGLLKHQVRSEDYWFSHQLLGRDIGVPWDSLHWDSDWKWHSMGDTPQGLWALWEQNVERSRAALEQVLRSDGLGGVVQRPPPNVEPASVRWVVPSPRRPPPTPSDNNSTPYEASRVNFKPRTVNRVIVSLIANTTTKKGLEINADLDEGHYPVGVKISNKGLAAVPSLVTSSMATGTTPFIRNRSSNFRPGPKSLMP